MDNNLSDSLSKVLVVVKGSWNPITQSEEQKSATNWTFFKLLDTAPISFNIPTERENSDSQLPFNEKWLVTELRFQTSLKADK